LRYQVLDSVLLSELQRQAEKIREQAEQDRSLEDRLAALDVLPTAAAPAAAHKPDLLESLPGESVCVAPVVDIADHDATYLIDPEEDAPLPTCRRHWPFKAPSMP
jgi:hypothetical protein